MNNSEIIIDSECDTEYDPLFENFLYLGTASYLILGLFLHIRILWTILIKERSYFKDNSFFILFAADSIASVSLILNDLLFTRVFMYIPQLCPIVSPFFWTPSIILKVIYFLNNHARFAKSVAQIFMVLNRMSCVIIPASYNKIWSTLTPIACVLVVILPFGGLWNILISRIFVLSVRGGFGTSYIRAVSWVTFATCLSCRSDALYIIQFMAFDTFTVGSAVIMVLTNQHIRSSIFSSSRKRKIINVTVTAMPSGRFSNTS
ncbi:hypothetical protein GCK72_006725 [Caenorhabditis remanei]|uniref:Serpentine receptor class gamma n=1 Tax=Caenorhabditis remanei TaxID=31234 RepID=A0A6A5HJJ0_CAERE|nr:hypothetical protein GCK72_006725 [Caenorhabditis remanei]KAF1766767.1 hypothetical protein GCK72_006725 [Caenorhabditis remanei]